MKLLLFDLGGVLVKNNGIETIKKLSSADFSPKRIDELWSESETVSLFESGKIRKEEFARKVRAEFGISCSPEDFLNAFEDWIEKPFDGALDLLVSLRKKFRIGCLSNTNEVHIRKLESGWQLSQYFDYTFYSYQLGCMKPDLSIYRKVVEAVPQNPSEIHFFDDNRENVNAAKRTGIFACKVDSFEDLVEELKKIDDEN